MPSALASMKVVTHMASQLTGIWCSVRAASGPKVSTPPSAAAQAKKKPKLIHTAGRRRNANGLAPGALAAACAPDPVPPGYDAWLGTALTLRRSSLKANTAQINALRAEIVTLKLRYPALTLPVELIHGTADTIVPLRIHSLPLSQILPNAKLTVIDGAGHMPHHAHADAVIAVIDSAALR